MGERSEDGRRSDGGSGGNAGEQGRDGGESRDDGGDESGNDGRPSTTEKATMVVSVGFALCLFAFAGWQIATPAAATTPEASVVGTETLPNGDVAVTVELRNPGDIGFVSTTVESNCTSPPASVEFTYVPASSTRRGTLVCPAGTADTSVSVANWVTA